MIQKCQAHPQWSTRERRNRDLGTRSRQIWL